MAHAYGDPAAMDSRHRQSDAQSFSWLDTGAQLPSSPGPRSSPLASTSTSQQHHLSYDTHPHFDFEHTPASPLQLPRPPRTRSGSATLPLPSLPPGPPPPPPPPLVAPPTFPPRSASMSSSSSSAHASNSPRMPSSQADSPTLYAPLLGAAGQHQQSSALPYTDSPQLPSSPRFRSASADNCHPQFQPYPQVDASLLHSHSPRLGSPLPSSSAHFATNAAAGGSTSQPDLATRALYDTPASPRLPSRSASPLINDQPQQQQYSQYHDSSYDYQSSYSPSMHSPHAQHASVMSSGSHHHHPGYYSGATAMMPLYPSGNPRGAAHYQRSPSYAASGFSESATTVYGDTPDANEKGYYGALESKSLGGSGIDETQPMVREKRKSMFGGAAGAGGAGGTGKGWMNASTSSRRNDAKSKKKWLVIGALVSVVILAAIIGIVMYLRNRDSSSSSSTPGSSANDKHGDSKGHDSTSGNESNSNADSNNGETGGDGSIVTMENGNTFVYNNTFGGYWVSTPFNDSARAQSYSPALNERWDYSSMQIYGVNIGGWLHLEPFIAPAMFEPWANTDDPAVDEWDVSLRLGDQLHDTMVQHFKTFITEQDFAQIAGAGLNWVRIALPYWAIETYPGEPFLEGVAWTYFLKAIEWARKYGLRINLDLHTIPGSQNGWNHSGKLGQINFLNGVMGMANGQRASNYIRVLTEFINQPQYRNVVPMWGIVNEAQANVIGDEVIRSYYLQIYNTIREITGFGEGNGPVISLHDGFSGNLRTWNGFLSGSDRIVMDSHPYLAFDTPNDDPMDEQIMKSCNKWGPMFNLSMTNVGFTYAGEFSLGINDCGQYLNGVGQGMRFDGSYVPDPYNVTGSCDPYMDASQWTLAFKEQLRDLALAEMDTFQNWFFWTWKIGESTVYNRVATPLWSYSLGLQEGYIPTDPRSYHGACPALAEKYNQPAPSSHPFDGSLEPWMTGGPGAGDIEATQLASYSTWPPTSMANIPLPTSLDVALLPTYTATAGPLTLTATATPTAAGASRIATPVLSRPYYTPIAGCNNYLDPWNAVAMEPTGVC